MTFPHGGCNSTWLDAMRSTGFHAAFAARALAFKPEADIHDPLYEMYPAEMTFHGFPIVNRFGAERPKEALLFRHGSGNRSSSTPITGSFATEWPLPSTSPSSSLDR